MSDDQSRPQSLSSGIMEAAMKALNEAGARAEAQRQEALLKRTYPVVSGPVFKTVPD